MKPESLGAYRFTILHGARVRSGSNYLGSIMGCNPHIQTVPPGRTMYSFRSSTTWAPGGAFATS
jgi:hypothetical protein